jgi:predicted ATP-grasp superfamily ATP-dependent carboligase
VSVIVTNAKSRIAYNVARSLGRRNIRVIAADFVPRSMCFVSRYVQGHFVYPSPFRDASKFIESLIDGIERSKTEVLIPVFEETFLISKYKDMLSPLVGLVLPEYSQILTAHNKDVWRNLARGLGIPTPISCSIAELRRAGRLRELQYPVLIKPKQGGGSWGIREVHAAQDLEALLTQDNYEGKDWERFFAQEKVRGTTHCVAMLFNHGQMKAKVAYRQLRDYPVKGGQATLRVSMRHEQAEEYFQTLLESFRWHGPCQADFMVDQDTGVPYLIDINPRLWGSLTQAIGAGVDFPYLIYRLAKEGDVAPVTDFKTGVVTRWIGGDLVALPSRLRSAPSKVDVMRDFVFPAKPAALFDDFSFGDPLPLLEWGRDALARAMKSRTVQPVSHDALEGIWE